MLFDRLFRAERPGPEDDFWYQLLGWGVATASGQRVSPETALRVSAVYACVRVLAESCAALPLILYRRLARGKERAREHPLYPVLHDRPNRWQTSFEWRERVVADLLLHGNHYSVIEFGPRGEVAELLPLPAARVRPIADSSRRRLAYEYAPADGPVAYLLDTDVLHVRGMSLDGVLGCSVLTYARESVGLALAAENYSAAFYANDATPRGILYHPQHFKDPETRMKFVEAWQRAQSGARRHKTAVLEDGMKYEPIGMTHSDAQFLEARKFQVSEIARVFRMPPHLIADLDRATNNNIEQLGLEFVTHTLQPWLVRMEQRYNTALLTQAERQVLFAEHLVDALLRGDQKTRYDGYQRAIQSGWLTRNEAREKENLNPLDGLDAPLEPLNMDRAGERPEGARDAGEERRRRDDRDAARVARREIVAVSEAYAARQNGSLERWAREYYGKLTRALRVDLDVDAAAAERYCEESLAELLGADDVPALLATWTTEKPHALARLRGTDDAATCPVH